MRTAVTSRGGATSLTFEDFHRARSGAVLLYARAILGPNGAEDACQEAWIRAWRAWGSADEAKVDAWLRSIVRNCCRDSYGAHRVVHPLDEHDLPAVLGAEEIVMETLEAAALWAELWRLPEALRETLWLREADDLSYAEIAERQQIPTGTVMSRLHAARAKLRRSVQAGSSFGAASAAS